MVYPTRFFITNEHYLYEKGNKNMKLKVMHATFRVLLSPTKPLKSAEYIAGIECVNARPFRKMACMIIFFLHYFFPPQY